MPHGVKCGEAERGGQRDKLARPHGTKLPVAAMAVRIAAALHLGDL